MCTLFILNFNPAAIEVIDNAAIDSCSAEVDL